LKHVKNLWEKFGKVSKPGKRKNRLTAPHCLLPPASLEGAIGVEKGNQEETTTTKRGSSESRFNTKKGKLKVIKGFADVKGFKSPGGDVAG